MARLSTHVLDTARGAPAEGIAIELFALSQDRRTLLKSTVTNADGRTDAPLLSGPELVRGSYELVFHAGDYFRGLALTPADPPFLDIIPIRFGISDCETNYHVPLLLSRYGYTTYRGS